MVLRLLGVCIVLVLIALSTHNAAAKLPSYVLTGGELGAYASHFHVPIPEEGDSWPLGLPGEDARGVDPPQQLPALSYDLYPSYGNFAVPAQLASGGPELRYYPELRMLQRLPNRWYQLGPETVAFLDTAIEDALVQKAAGELEMGPMAADFRARNLPKVEYWLRPRSLVAADDSNSSPDLGPCRECAVLVGSSEVFIMRHLVETASGTLQQPEPTSEPPAFAIEYYGIVEAGGGGIGGLLGSYTSPTDDHPGRFWPGSYTQKGPYFETTPGFDSVVAAAIAAADGSSDAGLGDGQVNSASTAEGGKSFPMTTAIGSGLAAALAALGGGTAALYARRRGRS